MEDSYKHSYNIGDFVRVKKDAHKIKPGSSYLCFVSKMNKYEGQCFSIKTITDDNEYHLDDAYDKEDGVYWYFHEDWLEPAEDSEIAINETDIMFLIG